MPCQTLDGGASERCVVVCDIDQYTSVDDDHSRSSSPAVSASPSLSSRSHSCVVFTARKRRAKPRMAAGSGAWIGFRVIWTRHSSGPTASHTNSVPGPTPCSRRSRAGIAVCPRSETLVMSATVTRWHVEVTCQLEGSGPSADTKKVSDARRGAACRRPGGEDSQRNPKRDPCPARTGFAGTARAGTDHDIHCWWVGISLDGCSPTRCRARLSWRERLGVWREGQPRRDGRLRWPPWRPCLCSPHLRPRRRHR